MGTDRRAALAALSAMFVAACGGGGGASPRRRWRRAAAGSGPGTRTCARAGPAGARACARLGALRQLRERRARCRRRAQRQHRLPGRQRLEHRYQRRPVDPNSDTLIASIGLTTGLHPDFGAGLLGGAPIGIPYVVVAGSQATVNIVFTAYGSESDPGPYPVPGDAPVEGGPAASNTGDRHVLVIDRDNNRLYELDDSHLNGDGSWNAAGGAVFDLDSDNVRPTAQPGWTSADAAGLPIFPGLARYEEAALGPGGIRHALRFTVQASRHAYVPPATHFASSNTSPNVPPMGMRVRLKASYAIPSAFSVETQAMLTAMKNYGMIVADNGSNWYISGAPDDRWDNNALVTELRQVQGQNFEVVRMDGLVTG